MKIFMIICFAILSMAFNLHAEPPNDTTASQLLVGTWSVPEELTTDVVLAGGYTLNADGSFISYGLILLDGERVRIDVEGTWKVKNGILVEEITKSSNPIFPPIGTITRDTILSVTDKEFRYQTENGKVTYEIRATD